MWSRRHILVLCAEDAGFFPHHPPASLSARTRARRGNCVLHGQWLPSLARACRTFGRNGSWDCLLLWSGAALVAEDWEILSHSRLSCQEHRRGHQTPPSMSSPVSVSTDLTLSFRCWTRRRARSHDIKHNVRCSYHMTKNITKTKKKKTKKKKRRRTKKED